MNYDEAIGALTDQEIWMEAGFAVGGYTLPWAADGLTGNTLPSEAFGLAGMAGSEMIVGQRAMTVGSGLYTIEALAERFGAKSTVQEVIANV